LKIDIGACVREVDDRRGGYGIKQRKGAQKTNREFERARESAKWRKFKKGADLRGLRKGDPVGVK